MTKKELLEKIAEASGKDRRTTEAVLDATLDELGRVLASGDSVALPGFGTFEVRDRAARTGRNPQTGEGLEIAASRAPAFKPAAALKRVVNGG